MSDARSKLDTEVSSKCDSNLNNVDISRKKCKRAICKRCKRPTPAACICHSLPNEPLPMFRKCRVIILQHPHECRRKNRSLPVIELCLGNVNEDNESINYFDRNRKMKDFNLRIVTGRRLGENTPKDVMQLISKPNTLLIYPSENAITLQEGLELLKKRRRQIETERKRNKRAKENESLMIKNEDGANCYRMVKTRAIGNNIDGQSDIFEDFDPKITLIFIDATWKYAKEMEKKNTSLKLWPDDLIRIRLCPPSESCIMEEKRNLLHFLTLGQNEIGKQMQSHSFSMAKSHSYTNSDCENITFKNNDIFVPNDYTPRRFDIRTPPSEEHLSTAECIAWVVSAIEEDNGFVYKTLMRPLDYMVKLWREFGSKGTKSCNDSSKNESAKQRIKSGSAENDDNNMELTKKKRKRQKLFQD